MQNRWNDLELQDMAPIDQLVYMSRLMGAETDLVLWGGGNTSLKLWETDFRCRDTYVLRVKGSGSDLRTIERRHFTGIRMEDALARRIARGHERQRDGHLPRPLSDGAYRSARLY